MRTNRRRWIRNSERNERRAERDAKQETEQGTRIYLRTQIALCVVRLPGIWMLEIASCTMICVHYRFEPSDFKWIHLMQLLSRALARRPALLFTGCLLASFRWLRARVSLPSDARPVLQWPPHSQLEPGQNLNLFPDLSSRRFVVFASDLQPQSASSDA